jgi:hypothetical protein
MDNVRLKLVFRELPYHLSGLLSYPTSIGMNGDSRQMHLTCSKFDEEQNVYPLQPQRIYGEEITSQDMLLVMSREILAIRRSIPCRLEMNVVAFEDVSNDGHGNCVVQFLQLYLNLAVPPAGFSFAIRTINSSISRLTRGLPPLALCRNVHLCRTSSRCQPNTVSG